MSDKGPTIFVNLSTSHVQLIEQSKEYQSFKLIAKTNKNNDKRYRITPGDFIREHIVDHYRSNKKDPLPQIIYDFEPGDVISGKVRMKLPADVLVNFMFDAKANLRSLKAQALYLTIPLIHSLLQSR